MNYRYLEFEDDINQIYYDIVDSGKQYSKVIGIIRGGMVPGVVLSHKLGIPFDAIHWSSSANNKDRYFQPLYTSSVLLVDDILDTGDTIKEIFDEYGKKDVACLIYNKNNPHQLVPDFYGRVIDREVDKAWIDFWWEEK